MADQNLKVNITGDSSKLSNALSSASGKLQAFGGKMKSVGKSMTTSLTLPLVAVGSAAVKMAFDFDKSMTSIQALVGVSADKVAEMGETAKKMAVDTGKSANEAAEALFFITSAGLRGSQAMDVLNMSLKASAVGLGETKTIADLSTSAMNAYGTENLSASGATDILTAAVREGKLEASALAGAMGGVIPLASNMGVSFDQVGASMAAMSKTGTDAATGATQLTAILASLKKPTSEAEAAFASMGMSTESVQESIREQGLLSTLEMLQNGLKQTGQDTTAIFPNIRALKGVLDLTGAGLEENRKVFDALTNSMGATDKAFEKTSQSASFKMTQGLNAMKSSLMDVGTVILDAVAPAVEKIGKFFTDLSDKFKNLSPETQKTILAFVGIVAAIGPVIAVLGTLLTLAPAIGAAFTLMMGPVGLVIAGLTAIAVIIYKNWAGIKNALIKVGNYFIELYNNSLPIKIAVNAIIMQFKNFLAVGKFVFKTIITVFKSFGKAAMAYLGSVGDILMGIFTLDMAKIKSGFSGIGDAMRKNFARSIDGIRANASELGGAVVDNFNDALNSKKIAKIKVEAESDLDGINFDAANGMSKDQMKDQVDKNLTDTPDTPDTPTVTIPVSPVLDPEAKSKLKAISDEINKALITNDKLSYEARKAESTKYYDDLISKVKKGSEDEKALQNAKSAALATIESEEKSRILDLRQQFADATNASEEQQKKLEVERIKTKFAEMRQLAIDNNLMTAEQQAAFDAAQAEAESAVYEEKKTRFLGFMMSMTEAQEMMQSINQSISGSFGALGGIITNAFGGADTAMGAFVGTMAKDALKIVGHNLKVSMSNAITGASESAKSFGPAAAFVLPALIAGATALVSSSFSKFADGGIVSGPTMGLVGEYPGARSNPEVIAPLNKLQGMIGGSGAATNVNVGGQIRLEGQDLLIAIERATETSDRIS
jgi:TP901 family phage tail tape measure protein